jgi:hypothetical protein
MSNATTPSPHPIPTSSAQILAQSGAGLAQNGTSKTATEPNGKEGGHQGQSTPPKRKRKRKEVVCTIINKSISWANTIFYRNLSK